jgi:hypothetical protein
LLRADGGDLRVLDAVKRRDQKTFTVLLRSKADINAAQPDGATALAWAVHLGEREMAEALLKAGANANTTDEYGETPLTLAAANGDACWWSGCWRPVQSGRGAVEWRDGADAGGGRGQPGCGEAVGAARRAGGRRGSAAAADRADVGGRGRV